MHFLFYGAGAIGSVTGGFLAQAGFDVTLCARPKHVEAIRNQNGLALKGWEESWIQPVGVVTDLSNLNTQSDWVIFLSVKSYDTEASLKTLRDVFSMDTPLVCLQNAVTNEDMAQKFFANVYGGVFKMTCAMLNPGEVLFRKRGQLVIGKHPQGNDKNAFAIVAALNKAGFQAELSEDITAEKWNKLLINLNSATHAIIATTKTNYREMARIRTAVVREGHEVLNAAGIAHEATVPGSQTMQQMLKNLAESGPPQVDDQHFMVTNGTWQNLYHRRKDIENGLYHETIIGLGRRYGIPVPYNQAVWQLLKESHEKQLGPEAFTTEELDRVAQEYM